MLARLRRSSSSSTSARASSTSAGICCRSLPLLRSPRPTGSSALAGSAAAAPRRVRRSSSPLTGAYALAFHEIYTEPNTRLGRAGLDRRERPAGSTIANEHWDDSLPVGGRRARATRLVDRSRLRPRRRDKLRKLYDGLARADYYSLSSPRAWRTIGRLPDRFPLMARFYEQLFAGRLGFREVASFTSEPRLFGRRRSTTSARRRRSGCTTIRR